MADETKKPIDPAHTATFVKTALHAAIWFAHKAGMAIADIQRVAAETFEDVKAEATAELAHRREAEADGA